MGSLRERQQDTLLRNIEPYCPKALGLVSCYPRATQTLTDTPAHRIAHISQRARQAVATKGTVRREREAG